MKWFFKMFALAAFMNNAQAADGVDWQALADRCATAGLANFKTVVSVPEAMDAFRAQLPEYAQKVLGFGAEVPSKDIKLTKMMFSYATAGVVTHPDLEEAVVGIDVAFVVQFTGPEGKVSSTLYTERIWAKNSELSYNCHYDENFRMGAVHNLPYGVDSLKNLVSGMQEL